MAGYVPRGKERYVMGEGEEGCILMRWCGLKERKNWEKSDSRRRRLQERREGAKAEESRSFSGEWILFLFRCRHMSERTA